MKKASQIIIAFIFASLSFYACGDDDTEENKPGEFADINELKDDPLLKEFLEIEMVIAKSVNDAETAWGLINDYENLTNVEKEQLVQALGMSSMEQMMNALGERNKVNTALGQKYDFAAAETEVLLNTFEEVINAIDYRELFNDLLPKLKNEWDGTCASYIDRYEIDLLEECTDCVESYLYCTLEMISYSLQLEDFTFSPDCETSAPLCVLSDFDYFIWDLSYCYQDFLCCIPTACLDCAEGETYNCDSNFRPSRPVR